MSRQLNFCK